MSVYGYARISAGKGLKIQVKALSEAVKEENIVTDAAGTNAFCALLERLQAGDLLVVPSLEALGSSYEAVLQAWKQVTGTGADIRVLDLPLLDTRQGAQVSGIVQQVLGFAAEQDKAFGINPAATSAQAGDPLCSACGTRDGKRPRGRPVRVGVEKHIRITDTQTANRIDALIARGSNFNKVVNDALFYGLPILYEKTVGGVTEVERRELTGEGQTGTAEDAFYATLMRLLKEIVLNVTINKSILSSLYHAAGAGLMGVKLKENFQSGLLSDTPEYLERYEAEGIKNLRR